MVGERSRSLPLYVTEGVKINLESIWVIRSRIPLRLRSQEILLNKSLQSITWRDTAQPPALTLQWPLQPGRLLDAIRQHRRCKLSHLAVELGPGDFFVSRSPSFASMTAAAEGSRFGGTLPAKFIIAQGKRSELRTSSRLAEHM